MEEVLLQETLEVEAAVGVVFKKYRKNKLCSVTIDVKQKNIEKINYLLCNFKIYDKLYTNKSINIRCESLNTFFADVSRFRTIKTAYIIRYCGFYYFFIIIKSQIFDKLHSLYLTFQDSQLKFYPQYFVLK